MSQDVPATFLVLMLNQYVDQVLIGRGLASPQHDIAQLN